MPSEAPLTVTFHVLLVEVLLPITTTNPPIALIYSNFTWGKFPVAVKLVELKENPYVSGLASTPS